MAAMLERIKSGNVALKKVHDSPKAARSDKGDVMAEMAKLLATRGGRKKRAPISIPAKEPPKQKSQMSNELFEKLKRRRGQQGEDMPDSARREAKTSESDVTPEKTPEKTPEPEQHEKEAAEPEERQEGEPKTQEEEPEKPKKGMTRITSVKDRIDSLSEAVRVSTTDIQPHVPQPESKGRVSIPGAFQKGETPPPGMLTSIHTESAAQRFWMSVW